MHSDTKKNKKKEHLNDVGNVMLKIIYKKKDVIRKWKIGFALYDWVSPVRCVCCSTFIYFTSLHIFRYTLSLKDMFQSSLGKNKKTPNSKNTQRPWNSISMGKERAEVWVSNVKTSCCILILETYLRWGKWRKILVREDISPLATKSWLC